MWDDRASKRNPKAPDFKCRNRPKMKGGPGCEGIIWPPRDGAPSPPPGAPGAAAGGSAGGAAARPWPGASAGGSGRAPSAPPRDAAPPPDDRDFDPGFGGPDDDDLPF
jgi:hypothetical protein